MSVRVIAGDCREVLKTLPGCSVHCVVTSPPYWGLRDYGTASWEGGDPACQHSVGSQAQDNKAPGAISAGVRPGVDASHCRLCGAVRVDQQIGMERHYEEHVAVLVDVFREVRRILRPDGTLWLNYGDCYASSVNGRSAADTKSAGNDDRTFRDKPFSTVCGTLKPKDLVGMPWRIAFALQEDGWWLRQDNIWAKRNCMPESVADRTTRAHEYVFMFTKSARYFYDSVAISGRTASATRWRWRCGIATGKSAKEYFATLTDDGPERAAKWWAGGMCPES